MAESQPKTPAIAERGIIVRGARVATAMGGASRELLARAPLVVLPEAGYVWRDYASIMERFATERRVFALDWPGFGESEPPADGDAAYAMLALSAFLGEWLTGIGVARCVIAANGLAAAVALRFAIEHPGRVAGLALIAPAGFSTAGRARSLITQLASKPWITRRFGTGLSSLALGPETPAGRAILERQRTQRTTPAYSGYMTALSAFWRTFDQSDAALAEGAASIQVPAVVVRGALDPIITEADAHRAAQSIGTRGALEIVLPGAGHLPFLQQPDRVLQAIAGVLETAELGAASRD